jgi:pimeloyl-ACP methyl ester carboxylesterase
MMEMSTQPDVNKVSVAEARDSYSIGSVTSQDGTRIGFRQYGTGPGVVILHGTMESAASHSELAEFLASDFSVYVPDRRGRGLSGPHPVGYGAETEVDDMAALLQLTRAPFVLGVSSGGIVWLELARRCRSIRKMAIFEPPLFPRDLPAGLVARYRSEIGHGDTASALVSAMLAAQMGPPILKSFPRWILKALVRIGMAQEEKHATDRDVTMRQLAPTIEYDFRLIVETSDRIASYKELTIPVLLLGGSKSPRYLKSALAALKKVLPVTQRVEFPSLHHGATGNKNRGGQPLIVSRELRRFFLGRSRAQT